MVVVFVLITLITTFGVIWFLEEKYPVHSFIGTTPVPLEYVIVTLAPHKERHRQTYVENVFLQMLHQVHHMSNITDCWVCGLLPSVMHKNDLLMSLPFSYLGSCEAWFQLFTMVYIHLHANAMNITYLDYEAVLEYIMEHQDLPRGGVGLLILCIQMPA